MRQILSPPLMLSIVLSLAGCAAVVPFHRTQLPEVPQHEKKEADRVEIVVGEPDPVLQGLAYVAETPVRILPFGPKPLRHRLSATTTEMITHYLEEQDLSDVYVCVDEYDPVGEWRRLTSNDSVGAGWRYSLGIASLVQYTLFPNPVFSANQYNPFTNRLSIDVDEPAFLLYEAAYAKYIQAQDLPGTYAALSMLPGISLISEVHAMNDVERFAQAEEDWELEKAVYRKLYPRVGTGNILIGMVMPLWWEQVLIGAVGPASGYVAGRIAESRRQRELASMTSRLAVEQGSLPPLSVEQLPNWVFIEEDLTKPQVRQPLDP